MKLIIESDHILIACDVFQNKKNQIANDLQEIYFGRKGKRRERWRKNRKNKIERKSERQKKVGNNNLKLDSKSNPWSNQWGNNKIILSRKQEGENNKLELDDRHPNNKQEKIGQSDNKNKGKK